MKWKCFYPSCYASYHYVQPIPVYPTAVVVVTLDTSLYVHIPGMIHRISQGVLNGQLCWIIFALLPNKNFSLVQTKTICRCQNKFDEQEDHDGPISLT